MVFRKLAFVAAFVLLLFSALQAQNTKEVKKTVRDLSSPAMHGRGYVKNGDAKAADYIVKRMKKNGLKPCFENYKQNYVFDVNTFPGKMTLAVDDISLQPGLDFIIHPATGSLQKNFELVWLPDTLTQAGSVYSFIDTASIGKDKIVVVPDGVKNAWRYGISGVHSLVQRDKGRLWWHVARNQLPEGTVRMRIAEEKLPKTAKQLSINLEARFQQQHQASNIAGFVAGMQQPDSIILFLAHYDHLGRMGKDTYFPGASDNASGTAFVLDLASYYASHPEDARYTMVFLLVSGEEAGLLGSRYFAANAPFDLGKVVFAINFDMVGTGSEGITVINAKQLPYHFEMLNDINQRENLFTKVVERGESCNSDHCPFYEKGVPSFFIHTQGPENQHYHDVGDKSAALPFSKHEALFRLITSFSKQLAQKPHKRF